MANSKRKILNTTPIGPKKEEVRIAKSSPLFPNVASKKAIPKNTWLPKTMDRQRRTKVSFFINLKTYRINKKDVISAIGSSDATIIMKF